VGRGVRLRHPDGMLSAPSTIPPQSSTRGSRSRVSPRAPRAPRPDLGRHTQRRDSEERGPDRHQRHRRSRSARSRYSSRTVRSSGRVVAEAPPDASAAMGQGARSTSSGLRKDDLHRGRARAQDVLGDSYGFTVRGRAAGSMTRAGDVSPGLADTLVLPQGKISVQEPLAPLRPGLRLFPGQVSTALCTLDMPRPEGVYALCPHLCCSVLRG